MSRNKAAGFVNATSIWLVVLASLSQDAEALVHRSQAAIQEPAEWIVAAISGRPFGTARAEWRKRTPQATWRQYLGDPFWNGNRLPQYAWPVGMWCAIADDAVNGVHRQTVFYALRSEEPIDCRIEQVTYEIEQGPVRMDPQSTLMAALTASFGPPDESSLSHNLPADLQQRGWISARHWYAIGFDLYLYSTKDRDGVLARHHVLRDQLSRDGVESLLFADWQRDRQFETSVRRQLPEFYDVALLGYHRDGQAAVIRAAERILVAQRAASSRDERAFLALVANDLVSRLQFDGSGPSPDKRPEMSALESFALQFEYSQPGDQWTYAGGLFEAVVRRYPETRWGRMALADKIAGGWISECADSYQLVVKHGLAWLDHNRTSPYRLEVTHAVAQAYETWWSLSLAPEQDELASYSREAAEPGSKRARLEAIRWYERLMREFPATVPALYAERPLMHLKLGVDTAQRRFQCVIN